MPDKVNEIQLREQLNSYLAILMCFYTENKISYNIKTNIIKDKDGLILNV